MPAPAFAPSVAVAPRHRTLLPPTARPSRPAWRFAARASFVPPAQSYHQMRADAGFRALLTRRAVWTVAFYMSEMRDSATRDWMLGYEGFRGRDASGTFEDDGAFVHSMLHAHQADGVMVMGHPTARFRREFKFTIAPMSVAKRILSVRAALADEWRRDLRCIELENKEIERMALERVLCQDEKVLKTLRKNVFDYDNLEIDQTPLRYKNYMKLKLFATQHAVSRFELHLRDHSNHDYMFFRRYRMSAQPIVDDEKFILGLMAIPPVEKTNPAHEIVPRDLARQLMALRAQVAAECIDIVAGVEDEQKEDERRRLEAALAKACLGYEEEENKSEQDGGDEMEETTDSHSEAQSPAVDL